MKRLVFIGLLVFCASNISAQRMWLMEGDTTLIQSAAVIDLSGEAGWLSNSMDTEMIDKLLFGGFIDRELIDRQANRMTDFMRFGAGFDGNLRFWIMRDSVLHSSNWGWQAQVQTKAQLGFAAPRDMYHLAFKGNAPQFLGKTANMNETWFDYQSYQKFGLGLVHKPTLSGFVLSAVNGQEFERFYLTQGGLFTSESGDSLALLAMGDRFRSDTSVTGFGTGNGIGIALDGVLNIPLKEDKGFVSIGVTDFGFVAWNDGTQHQRIDTLWSFTGVDVADLITDGESALPQFDDSLFISTNTGRQNRWLSGFVYTRLMHRINQRDFFDVTMIFRPINAFLPQFSAGYHHSLPGRALVGGTVTYGGFGGVRFGVSAEKWFGNNWFASLATEDLYGLAARRGRGMGGAVRLTYVLKRNETSSLTTP